jgi:hypothetical protein
MELEFSRHIFEQCSNIELHENTSMGSRGVPCGRTDRRMEGRTDITKLMAAFRIFANAPYNESKI